MQKHLIYIEETLSSAFCVEAASREEAYKKVMEMYSNNDINWGNIQTNMTIDGVFYKKKDGEDDA